MDYTLIIEVLKWAKRPLVAVWRFIAKCRSPVPRQTLRILAQTRGCWWHMGSVADKPAMQVVADWHITNITEGPVYLLKARIAKPLTEGSVFTRHPKQDVYGRYPILPRATTEARSDFWITPPVRNVGENFKTTVVLTDQYGNDHKLKNVIFRGPKPKEPQKQGLPVEPISSITDDLEKAVVAVLKAEVLRYKQCGRKVGGLGSIETVVAGHRYKGIGTEWREPESPKNQSIILNTEEVEISSDNAGTLLGLYGRTRGDAEKERFTNTLLMRLSKETEYASIGYFILYVLFSIGRLPDALAKASQDLRGDDAYGFGDFLRLLDGLLRLRHDSFSAEMLDQVERFIAGLDEYTFRVTERITAIRALRVAEQGIQSESAE